jgi:hypothetical protein
MTPPVAYVEARIIGQRCAEHAETLGALSLRVARIDATKGLELSACADVLRNAEAWFDTWAETLRDQLEGSAAK